MIIYSSHVQKKRQEMYDTFPDGTVESNETIEEAVICELKEEIFIIATPNCLVYHLKINNIKCDNNLGTKNKDEEGYNGAESVSEYLPIIK
jgi:hypothetical protein